VITTLKTSNRGRVVIDAADPLYLRPSREALEKIERAERDRAAALLRYSPFLLGG
jgi:hypothetical protein